LSTESAGDNTGLSKTCATLNPLRVLVALSLQQHLACKGGMCSNNVLASNILHAQQLRSYCLLTSTACPGSIHIYAPAATHWR
jgi:hypothetical protein